MASRKNVINGLLFFAPIGIVLSAIPQAPDYTTPIGWGLALVMLGTALALSLRDAKARSEKETQGAGGDEREDRREGQSTQDPS